MPGGPGSPKIAIIQLHKSFGITVLLLSIARIIWRLMNPPPPSRPCPPGRSSSPAPSMCSSMSDLAMPLTGWIMASAEIEQHDTRFFCTFEMYVPGIPGLPAETRKPLAEGFEQVHHNLAWVIVGLLVLHVAGAVKHQLRGQGRPSRAHGARRLRPHGRSRWTTDRARMWAFGAAIAVFAVVAGLSLAPPNAAPPPTIAEADQAPASKAPAWGVDYEKSAIAFKAAYMGRAFEGRFPGWTAQIQLDTDAPANPDTPVDGYVRVVIPMGKVTTGEPYFDENVTQGDWFDATKHPEAVFEVKGGVYKVSDTQYEATGVLTLKGVDHPVRLPFTLAINGATATMHGEIMLKRLALGVGGDTPAAAKGEEEWVRDDVRVVIDVVATRQ